MEMTIFYKTKNYKKSGIVLYFCRYVQYLAQYKTAGFSYHSYIQSVMICSSGWSM